MLLLPERLRFLIDRVGRPPQARGVDQFDLRAVEVDDALQVVARRARLGADEGGGLAG